MSKESLHDVYVDTLKDLYSAERQIIAALPKLAKAAESDELRAGFEEHLDETHLQVQRLEQIIEGLGKSPRGKKCKGMEGLIEEGKHILEEMTTPSAGRDAALIAAAQRVEHYEIATYGSARTFADELGERAAAKLLQQTLEEEAAANEKLTSIAENGVNREAAAGDGSRMRGEGGHIGRMGGEGAQEGMRMHRTGTRSTARGSRQRPRSR
jgi:ferritin-like metal-binding protein YciE